MSATTPTAEVVKATLSWAGEVGFEAEGLGRAALRVDQPTEKGGSGVGFKPVTLLLHALAGCMATTIVMILAKQRLQPAEYRVEVTGEREADWPKRFTRIEVEHVFRGEGLTRANLERLVAMVDEKYCSVSATLPRGLVEHHVRLEGEATA